MILEYVKVNCQLQAFSNGMIRNCKIFILTISASCGLPAIAELYVYIFSQLCLSLVEPSERTDIIEPT